jgi:hypothetical protein
VELLPSSLGHHETVPVHAASFLAAGDTNGMLPELEVTLTIRLTKTLSHLKGKAV